MKLNNHGWGLREMLILSSVLLLFLLVSVFLVLKMYNRMDEDFTNDKEDDVPVQQPGQSEPSVSNPEPEEEIDLIYYLNLEKKLETAGRNYWLENMTDESLGGVNIYLGELADKGYVQEIKDQISGNPCDGYARIFVENSIATIDGYIKCDNYKTEGYVG